jgi:hypothetical protein
MQTFPWGLGCLFIVLAGWSSTNRLHAAGRQSVENASLVGVRSPADSPANTAAGGGNGANFRPTEVTIIFHFSNNETRTYRAANLTTNQNGNPCEIGSHAPCPAGRWFLNPPLLVQPGTPHYGRVGPAFFRIGRPGSIPYLRDLGLHAGSDSYRDLTYGCIRMTNDDLHDLLNYVRSRNLVIESLEIPGTAACADTVARVQPAVGAFAADALENQASRDGIDYMRAFDQANSMNPKGLGEMFRVTPDLDGGAAEDHSATLYDLLEKFGDQEYAAVLGREKALVRTGVVRALDFFTATESTMTKSAKQWRKQFPATAAQGAIR